MASDRERELETSSRIFPRKTMRSHNNEVTVNSVNGNRAGLPPVVSLGQTRHVEQVASDRHPATVLGQTGHVEQVASDRHPATVSNRNKIKNHSNMRIATWNVNTLYQAGKLANVESEMRRLKVNVMGISEVRWSGVGSAKLSGGGCFIYSGGDKHEHGVGVMIDGATEKSLAGYYAVSERVLMVKLKGAPFDICVIQVYAPTCEYDEEIVTSFYADIMKAKQQCRPHDIIIVMGDLNAKLGQGRGGDAVGPYGLGERNGRGDRWEDWCIENEMVVLNTWFKQPPRRLWTWMAPGDRCRNQIDYVSINRRFRNTITSTRTFPGADCGSDHVPVVVEMRIRLKKVKRKQINPKNDMKVLKRDEVKEQYRVYVRNKYDALSDETEEENNLERQFENLREAIEEANKEIIPKVKKSPNRPWMTDMIMDLMDERRECKGRDHQRYKVLNRRIHRECLAAKTRWMEERCAEIEDLDKRDNQLMYKKVQEIVGRRKFNSNIAIKKADGTIAMEVEEVKARWDEYIGELFLDQRPETYGGEFNNEGPVILKEEVKKAMKSLKAGKAVGSDGIDIEMLDAIEEFALDELTSLFNSIYETGNIISSMCESIFVALPKVEGTLECKKHRTISIMSQMTKMLLRVILNRVRSKIRPAISEEQFGFVPGRGTRNAIFTFRVLAERVIEVQKDLYVCFVDYEKAFDKVRHPDLFEILEELGLDGK